MLFILFVFRAFFVYVRERSVFAARGNCSKPLKFKHIWQTFNYADFFGGKLAIFTSMSEKMSPEEVVTMLNTYFAYITEPIMANNGVINKFIGDAVMAVFTPHLGSENHVEDAIKAAKEMRERLANLNNSKELKSEIKFGIGLNTGPLIAGNIGTQKRFEYTVIGDTVNVASRMESLSKALEHDIILSESTAEKIDKEFAKTLILEKSDPVQIKGKSLPMPVYKLIGFKTD
jgi:adenylate cyclase